MELILIRHGQTEANADNIIQGQRDTALSELGLQQIQATAQGLANEHFDVVYSSDLQRALITAKTIAPYANVIPDPRLREWNLGLWQGHSLEEVQRTYPNEYREFIFGGITCQISGGEARSDLFRRCTDFLQDIIQLYGTSDSKILTITHGGILSVFLPILLNMDKPLKRRPLSTNCSISRFKYLPDIEVWQLCSWNDTRYLDGLLAEKGNY